MSKLTTKECKKRGLDNNFNLLSNFISHKIPLKWKCLICGHTFNRLINNIRPGRGCPKCTTRYSKVQNKVCVVCGKAFKATHGHAKTCSFRCRNKLNYKYPKKEKVKKKCPICSASFSTNMKNKVYCSTRCRTKDRYRKENAKPQTRIRKHLTMRIKALTKRRDYSTFSKLVGCTIRELRTYLESKWQPGMTWDNYKYNGWHIDHIRPLCSFDLNDKKQVFEANHYTNLQPLWADENFSKGGKWNGLDDKTKR
jgi:predicted nucleic acid-binding Zn ribbon protein